MAILGWFKKKEKSEDYETILSNLTQTIQIKEQRLSELRLRERRASLVVTLYAFGFWVLYLGLWWTFLDRVKIFDRGVAGRDGVVRRRKDKETIDRIVKSIPAVVGPIAILFVRRIVQLFYHNKGDAEEKHIKSLRSEQRSKIEEIKKKTNFYSTKSLLDRYDEGTPRKPAAGPNTPNNLRNRHLKGGPGPSQGMLSPQSAVRGPGPAAGGVPTSVPRGREPGVPAHLQGRFPGVMIQQQPMTPPRKQWYDKLADALLGDDEATTGSSSRTRFALICENCFAHNGLVREEDYDDMKYLCPKCGHFNASPRQKRDGSRSVATSVAGSRAPSLAPTINTVADGRRAGSSSPPLPSPSRSRFSVGSRRGRDSAASQKVEEEDEEEESHEEEREERKPRHSSDGSERMDVDKEHE
ncbi:hypothetical protein FRC03_007219 [Tulasnella sp. 419]|nr:hypothetical protein FRC03_007219 [Tulasnella sp. 419]